MDVPAMVRLGVGADVVDFFPHWLYGLYGDFDRNGSVDTADLSQFSDYWLRSEIADVDYNQDGIVNSYEFATFAGN